MSAQSWREMKDKDKEIICKHCGATILPEEFRPRQGKVCRTCGNAYRHKWLADNAAKEKYCPKCKIRVSKDAFLPRHRWCNDCDAKYGKKELTSEEKIERKMERSKLLEEFKYKNRAYQDGDVINLFQADAEENAVRMKIYSVQKQIAEHQVKQQPSLQQQGNYWIWK